MKAINNVVFSAFVIIMAGCAYLNTQESEENIYTCELNEDGGATCQ